jgi:hypothetical protein
VHTPNRFQDFGWGRVFKQVRVSSSLNRLADIALAAENGQKNRTGLRTRTLDPSRYADTVNARHSQIQQHNVGLVPLDQIDRLCAIPRPSHHHHILGLGQNRHDSIRYHGMIIRDEYSDTRPVHFFHYSESSIATGFNNPSLERGTSLRQMLQVPMG